LDKLDSSFFSFIIEEVDIKALEKLCRDLIVAKFEGAKVELKSEFNAKSKRNIAELAKRVIALTNTDSSVFENSGYIILGAERGKIIGGMDFLQDDTITADLQNSINKYTNPPIDFDIYNFKESDGRIWGVFFIPESIRQPHFVAKEFTDQKGSVFRKNDCYVRRGDRCDLANPVDFERMYSKKSKNIEKRMNFLEKKLLTKEKSKEPRLSLCFFDSENNPIGKAGEIQIGYPNNEQVKKIQHYINKTLTYVKPKQPTQSIPYSPYEKLFNIPTFSTKVSEEQYLSGLKEYYSDIFKKTLLTYRCVKIAIGIRNTGDVTVNDVIIFVKFPYCQVYPNEKFLRFNMKPGVSKQDFSFARASIAQRIPGNVAEETVQIEQKRDNAVITFKLNKLLHRIRYTFPTIFAVVPLNMNKIEISYIVHAENLSEPIKDSLYLNLNIIEEESKQLEEIPAYIQQDLLKYYQK